MNAALILTFVTVTQTFKLPPGLLSAVCFTESRHNVRAYVHNDGGSPSVGVCQLKLSTAKLVGFRGNEKDLANPTVNVYYAGAYLRRCLSRYDNDLRKGVAAYNAGAHRVDDSGRTKNWKYVSKVLVAWSKER